MNFFGHAAIAAGHFSRRVPEAGSHELPRLCAGAMLPDFVGMLRLRKPQVRDASVARGVAFHHRTDQLFHELVEFQRLSRAAFAWLAERGSPRGPSRAIAHIGVEMLLDEVLARESIACDAYRAALELPLTDFLEFQAAEDAERLSALSRALLARTAVLKSPPAEMLAERIARTLAGRPRLAVDSAGQQLLASWVTQARPLVESEAPELLATLRARLANAAGAE